MTELHAMLYRALNYHLKKAAGIQVLTYFDTQNGSEIFFFENMPNKWFVHKVMPGHFVSALHINVLFLCLFGGKKKSCPSWCVQM